MGGKRDRGAELRYEIIIKVHYMHVGNFYNETSYLYSYNKMSEDWKDGPVGKVLTMQM